MVTDPISDMLSQIKNASMAKLRTMRIPYSSVKYAIAKTLMEEGYLSKVDREETESKTYLVITLAYENGVPVLTDLKRKSKPGLRRYVSRRQIPVVVGGMGMSIVSTPAGIMSGKNAKKKGIGGELICEVW